MVEFALVAVLFFGLFFGALEFGRLWYYSTHLENSVRAAARYGAVLNPPSLIYDGTQGASAYATAEINSYLDPAGLTTPVTTTVYDNANNPRADGTADHGNTIMVTATYNFEFLTGSFLNSTFTIWHTEINFNIPTSITLTREASANYE